MGKRAVLAKKRRRLQSSIEQKFAVTVTGNFDEDDIPPEDLEICLSVLSTLSTRPALLASPHLRDLKKSIRMVNHLMGDASGNSLTARISQALRDCRFDDAFVLLLEMYTKRIPPKLGALQRWVRECDAIATVNRNRGTDATEEGLLEDQRDEDAMRCLDLMLRIVNPEMDKKGKRRAEQVISGDVWSARGDIDGEIDIWRKIQDGSIPSPSSGSYPGFRVVSHTPGHLRRPPNRYASTVYASLPSTISLTPAPSRRPTQKVEVPGVPGAFMVLDVFTPGECEQIVKVAMGIGMEKDEAVEGSARFKSSILARNLVWLADRDLLDHFYKGILPFVPQNAPVSDKGEGGGRVRGINARFRVYEYRPNQTYRPHIDGAWPAAGLDPVTGGYLHDSSSPDDPLWSRYTLLVYLNSDIPVGTGSTTFFLPSSTLGIMESVAVRPIQGAVLCFPHGDTAGSLLHEGSAVGPEGGKFVIRTDLLYEARGFGAFKPSALAPASVGENKGGKGEEGIGG